ncbi:prosaposin-like isoform X2 [Hypanus sabinus]|uniref:prosaposin-like isoform X2 n=1 Tax=Hypanus sabinus TaxID=79690 RepID=UPI0028C3F377|nr:prosaposin-like isoform X2 [Hypanus sabinus]
MCENFVQSYKKELSKLLQKSQEEKDICWKPEVMCSTLGLCKSLSQFPQQEVRSNTIPEQQPSLAHLLPSRLYPASRIPQQGSATQLAAATPELIICYL